MYFKQFYLGCLAHASYLVGGSNGDAAVVDPQRDVDLYLSEARERGLNIRHVIETHLHADFVSGHIELAARTGARIYFGHRANVRFEFVAVRDKDLIDLGDTQLQFWETPGHTPESISLIVMDAGTPKAVLTGDTLFIGDVGRPDLLSGTMQPAELASMLYDSLHGKLLTLPDDVSVYPAHGAGSLCGRNISSDRSSTIGRERRFNYALKPMSKEEFIRMVTVDLPEAPPYFRMDVEMNRKGAGALERLPELLPLTADEVVRRRDAGDLVLDTRGSAEYGAAHIPGALNVGLAGQFAGWCGTLIPASSPILLVAETAELAGQARIRLARVGLEQVGGFLDNGILGWSRSALPLVRTEQISVDELHARRLAADPPAILDVRRIGEWNSGHIAGAVHVPLHELRERTRALPEASRWAVICAGGYRSTIATSILEQQGVDRIANVVGGMAAWTGAGFDTIAGD
jgi:glyoxylase-like metal-dependent hydrolase (beta-lactamase superfamily II)/rhodanese-related sulfurtransferase